MPCQRCNSNRVVSISGKCDDRFFASSNGNQYDGYVPYDLGIGGGDNIDFDLCLECGQIQGEFPMEPAKIEGRVGGCGNCSGCKCS